MDGGLKRFDCNADHQAISRCDTRGETEDHSGHQEVSTILVTSALSLKAGVNLLLHEHDPKIHPLVSHQKVNLRRQSMQANPGQMTVSNLTFCYNPTQQSANGSVDITTSVEFRDFT